MYTGRYVWPSCTRWFDICDPIPIHTPIQLRDEEDSESEEDGNEKPKISYLPYGLRSDSESVQRSGFVQITWHREMLMM